MIGKGLVGKRAYKIFELESDSQVFVFAYNDSNSNDNIVRSIFSRRVESSTPDYLNFDVSHLI